MHSWLKMQLVGNRIPFANRPTSDGAACDPLLNESAAHATRVSPQDFSELYLNYFDVAWRALRRYGVPALELEDALQEVFLTVHARWHSFEGRSSLRTWIFGISRRVAREHRPTSRLEICDPGCLDELPADAASDRLDAEQRENARILYAMLAELSPERRELIVLVELEHLTVAEAAEILGENANTLQSRLRAARAELSSAWARRTAAEDWRRGCAANNRR
jgi:RNA polymerase sigma-70 factor, ECF subfamily